MPISATTPVTVPAQAQVVYDTWWVARLYVQSDDASRPTTASVVYRLGRIDTGTGAFVPYIDGNGEFTEKLLEIPDLFALAASNSDVNNCIASILTTVGTLAKGQGVIS
jgi:hypothetical protein